MTPASIGNQCFVTSVLVSVSVKIVGAYAFSGIEKDYVFEVGSTLENVPRVSGAVE